MFIIVVRKHKVAVSSEILTVKLLVLSIGKVLLRLNFLPFNNFVYFCGMFYMHFVR